MKLRTALIVAALAGAATPAWADKRLVLPADPKWKAECGSCHLPYPPRLLPSASWRTLMARLDRHYGTDASLDPQAATEIGRLLSQYAGSGSAPAGEEPRITETIWFRNEHRKVRAALWSGPSVRSPANCAACHLEAERGEYSERTLRVPAAPRLP